MKNLVLILISITLFVMCTTDIQVKEEIISEVTEIEVTPRVSDSKKVKILRDADVAGAVKFIKDFGGLLHPTLMSYGTLWAAFSASRKACTWCPKSLAINNRIEKFGFDNTRNELFEVETIFLNSITEEYDYFGKTHNDLLFVHTSNLFITIEEEGITTEFGELLISDHFNFETHEFEELIQSINDNIDEVDELINIAEDERLTIAINECSLSSPVKEYIVDFTEYINENEMDIIELAEFLVNTENAINTDELISAEQKSDLFKIISIYKYSHAFWYYAEGLL